MDKLRRVLSGNDYVAEEESGIIHQVPGFKRLPLELTSYKYIALYICALPSLPVV